MTDFLLGSLVELTHVKFEAEQSRLQDIVAQENRLRGELRRLEDRHRAAQAEQQSQFNGQRAFGGDVLWQAWVTRTRHDLQIRLAQVLAQKGRMMRSLQLAHGRKLAAKEVFASHEQSCRTARRRRDCEAEQSLTILKSRC